MTTRITGLSNSGLDTDALVKSIMQAKRASYERILQQKTQTEWKKADDFALYKSLSDFRNNTVFNFKMTSSLATKKAVSSDDSKVSAVANADAATFTHTIDVTKLATGASLSSNAKITGSISSAAATIVLNGINVEIGANSTMNDIASAINNTAGVNVKANYDATLNRFFMVSTNSGADAKIDLTGNTSAASLDILKTLKLADATATAGPIITGQNAEFTLDGATSAELGINTNNFTVSGVKYNLKAVTNGTISIGVSSDTDKMVANVKSFIESYNTMLGSINTKINETKYRDFLPLSADQKAAMSESEVTEWEKKAKSGMLKNDATLSALSYAMRENFAKNIEGLTGSYTTAANIGITSGLYSEKGKLYLDEDKLKAALEADPEIVQKMFGTDGTTANKDGIAVRLYDTLKVAIDKIKVDAGTTATIDYTSNLGKKISAYEKTLADLNTRLNAMEDSYYMKFSAMETALTKINSQSSWLSQQLGSS